MIYVDLPFQPMLILGSVQACNDLLEKRSNIYSDRVPIVMDDLYEHMVAGQNSSLFLS